MFPEMWEQLLKKFKNKNSNVRLCDWRYLATRTNQYAYRISLIFEFVAVCIRGHIVHQGKSKLNYNLFGFQQHFTVEKHDISH